MQGGEPKWAWCLCSCTQRKVRSNEGLGSGRTATGLDTGADGVRVSLAAPGTVSVRACVPRPVVTYGLALMHISL